MRCRGWGALSHNDRSGPLGLTGCGDGRADCGGASASIGWEAKPEIEAKRGTDLAAREQLASELVTVRDYIRWGMSELLRGGAFYGHGTDNAYDEALQLVLHALRLPLDTPPTLLDARLARAERLLVLSLLETRVRERVPAAYLTGEAWFAGLPFKVDERVLIPRSPIAELIEAGFEPWLQEAPARVLDLCTGSGCIGIVCAYAFPAAEVVLSDVSEDALAVAQDNIERHGLQQRVRAVHSDLFAALSGQRFDLIVSNPPYVDAADLAGMPREYHHEPRLGLAAGEDGLEIVRRLLRDAAEHLNPGGLLVVEVGNSAAALEHAYPEAGFTWIEFERGGEGVFVLGEEDLRRCAGHF